MSQHTVEFFRSGRGKAQCPADPAYPHGIAIDGATAGAPSCLVPIPYPAPECGVWIVRCQECETSIAITAAGRADDPVSVRIACSAGEGAVMQ